MSEQLQEIYRKNSSLVRSTGLDQDSAIKIYEKYISFIVLSTKELQTKGKLLDVGCGSAWSSYFLSQKGYEVTGIDLNYESFECPKSSSLTLLEASALDLPFDNNEFDVVASNQAIEHMPDPEKALLEMIRVLKPNGMLCIVAPNLLSIGDFILALTKYMWLNKKISNIFWRSPDMPKHPWGNTIPEVLFSFPRKLNLILRKSSSQDAEFTMRVPDTIPPFHADNDACYLCNPIDLVKFFPTQNCKIIQNGFYGRPAITRMIATGTYIAAQKQK
jgi:SAM-dependent methyltransferase